MISRRGFLKSLLAAGALVALPSAITRTADGVLVYRMLPGEVLDGLDCPEYGRVIVADNCKVLNCKFKHTSLIIEGENVRIENLEICDVPEGQAAIVIENSLCIGPGVIAFS